jgi:hypothetical protein
MHDPSSKHYDPIGFLKIAVNLRRSKELNLDFWKTYFKTIPEIMKNAGKQWEIFFIQKTLEIDSSTPEYSEVIKLLNDFKKNHPELIIEDLEASDGITPYDVLDTYSVLNIITEKIFQDAGLNYQKEALRKIIFR